MTTYASEADTQELIRIGKLPAALRLAELLEQTMQWPLHGKAADELRRLHAIEQAVQQPAAWVDLTDEDYPDDGRYCCVNSDFMAGARWAAAKLREKNAQPAAPEQKGGVA